MKLIVHIKKDADIHRIADYINALPKIKGFEDVLDFIEPIYEEKQFPTLTKGDDLK